MGGYELPNDRLWPEEVQAIVDDLNRNPDTVDRDTVITQDGVTELVIDLNTLTTDEVLLKHFAII